MKEVFLLISESGACLFSPPLNRSHVRFDIGDAARDIAKQIEEGLGIVFKGKKLVLAANSKKTLIRVADVQEFGYKRGFMRGKISGSDAWDVIKSVFPIGTSINEDTFLFDISLFGDKKYVCFGLPVFLCEKFAEIGKELAGSIHRVSRLETVENLVFAQHSRGSEIVIFPQDGGLRVLAVKDGLPENAFFISNHPDRRGAEFELILDDIGGRRAISMSCFMPLGTYNDLEWIEKYK